MGHQIDRWHAHKEKVLRDARNRLRREAASSAQNQRAIMMAKPMAPRNPITVNAVSLGTSYRASFMQEPEIPKVMAAASHARASRHSMRSSVHSHSSFDMEAL